MRCTLPPARNAAPAARAGAVGSGGDNQAITAAQGRGEQGPDRGLVPRDCPQAAYNRLSCRHRGPRPDPGQRRRVRQASAR